MRTQSSHSDSDSQLIWESLKSSNNNTPTNEIDKLFEKDLEYITEFLINEGLLDAVKSGFGKVKDFASQKLLQPIVDMAMKALAKLDPELAQKLATASQSGDSEQIQSLLSPGEQEAQKIVSQSNQSVTQQSAEAYANKFELNSIICEALVDTGIISSDRSQVIQERYYSHACSEMLRECKSTSKDECPHQPRIITEARQNYTDIASQISALIKTSTRPHRDVFPKLMKISRPFANFAKKQTASQTSTPPPKEPVTPPPKKPVTSPPKKPVTSPPEDVESQQETQVVSNQGGILSSVWNFVKSNKIATTLGALGVLSIALAALPVGGALAPILAAAAAKAKIGAAIGATVGGLKSGADEYKSSGERGETGLQRLGSTVKSGLKGAVGGAARGSGTGALAGGAAEIAAGSSSAVQTPATSNVDPDSAYTTPDPEGGREVTTVTGNVVNPAADAEKAVAQAQAAQTSTVPGEGPVPGGTAEEPWTPASEPIAEPDPELDDAEAEMTPAQKKQYARRNHYQKKAGYRRK